MSSVIRTAGEGRELSEGELVSAEIDEPREGLTSVPKAPVVGVELDAQLSLAGWIARLPQSGAADDGAACS